MEQPIIIEENIIEKCINAKIPFSVGVSHIETKNKCLDGAGKDYFLIALHKDIIKTKVSNYKISDNKITAEVTLNKDNYDFFRTICNDFIKVVHCAFGRIYEYSKLASFQKTYRNIREQIHCKKQKENALHNKIIKSKTKNK